MIKKTLYLAIIVIINYSLFITHCSAQWVLQTLPVSGTINDIGFLNIDTGFVALDNYNLLRTTNSGDNWIVTLNIRIKQLEVINDTTIYGVQSPDGNRLYRTFNGGTTWDSIGMPITCAVSFINKDTGWLTGTSGIYKTTNGGVSLQLISTENSCCTQLQMLKNSYNGEYYGWSIRAFSDAFYKTTNSGINWTVHNFSATVNSIFLLNKDTGWVGIDPPLDDNKLLSTKNNGMAWDTQLVVQNAFHFYAIAFANGKKGWANTGSSSRIGATSTGGIVWGTQINPSIFEINRIYIIDSLNVWISGGLNKLIKTTNGGGTITFVDYENNLVPEKFILNQNYPNPFNSQTTISFSLKERANVDLNIFDITGKEVLIIFKNHNFDIGNYKAIIDLSKINLSSGVYFYSLTAYRNNSIQYVKTNKMIYNK